MSDLNEQGEASSQTATTASPGTLHSLHSLSDDLLCSIASFLEPRDLLNQPVVSRRFRSLDGSAFDSIWRQRCASRWENWPRYRMTPARVRRLDEKFPREGWKRRFLLTETDVARTTLRPGEIEELGWYFNFTPEAGGLGDETLTRAIFRDGSLHLPHIGYAPLPYRLVDVNTSQQQLMIAPFPAHNVQRNYDDKEWLITNSNVTLVSCGDEGELRFKLRGFRRNIASIDIRIVNDDVP
ncbi:hypothetical protein ACHAWF_001264 [Thalassiosira exigua]